MLLVLSYLIGSIPFGLLFAKWFSLGDIRHIGSGNIGATNVLRTGNRMVAFLTLLCDMLKGALCVLICTEYPLWAGLMAILGHTFPIWLKFKGGKGVATAFGVYLVVMPFLGVSMLLTWLLSTFLFKKSSLSALNALFFGTIIASFLYFLDRVKIDFFLFSWIIFVLILFLHRENIQRLLNGSEKNIM
jgi:glycerol-3-phosphate acyltransferase PlsY